MTDEHDHDHDEHEHEHEGHDHGHEVPPLSAMQHREQGVALFNQVWEMLKLPDRTPRSTTRWSTPRMRRGGTGARQGRPAVTSSWPSGSGSARGSMPL